MDLLVMIKAYWLQALAGGTLTIAGLMIKRLKNLIKSEHEEQLLLREGVIAILHDRLYFLCGEYIKSGIITISELNNLKYLYYAYHKLGGNGTGEELYNRCLKLPIKAME